MPTSTSHLSDVLRVLAGEVFAGYLGRPHLSLLAYPGGEGTAGVLGPDGQRAWEATRDFLARFYELPDW